MIIILIDNEDDKMVTTRQNASQPASEVCISVSVTEMSLEDWEFFEIKIL